MLACWVSRSRDRGAASSQSNPVPGPRDARYEVGCTWRWALQGIDILSIQYQFVSGSPREPCATVAAADFLFMHHHS
jgi:hypothetical protein